MRRYNLPRLNHDEIGNLNRSIMSANIKNFPTKKSPQVEGFPGGFNKHLRVSANLSETPPKN